MQKKKTIFFRGDLEMKIHLFSCFWIILIFSLININATDSNSEENFGEEKALGSKTKRQVIGNEASSSGKKEAETEMELNLGKREAMRILMNMIKPVFIKFTEHIATHYGVDVCKILNRLIKKFKKIIEKKENKKYAEFNQFMRKMDRKIKNETKNIGNVKESLEHIFFFRIMLQIAKLIEEKRGRNKEIQFSDTESDEEIDKDDKMTLFDQIIKKSIDQIEIWIRKKKVNQEENYKIFMENYVNKIKINLKNDAKENGNDMDEDEDDDNETLSDRSKSLKGIQNEYQSSMETSSSASDFEYEEEETSDDDYEPIIGRKGMKRKRNHKTNQQKEHLIENSDSEDNQSSGKRRNILVQALPIQPINPSEVRFPNVQKRQRNSSKSPNNSGSGHTSPSKNANSNPSNSKASGTIKSKSPTHSHFTNHSAHPNSSSSPLMVHSPMDIENNSESIHSDSSSSKNSPPKLESTSSQKRQNPESSNNQHATENQQIDHLQQKLKINLLNSLSSNVHVPKRQRSLKKYKGKGLNDKQSKDLNPKQTNQLESNQMQISDKHSAAINIENAKNSDQAETGSILHPNFGIPINQLMETPFLQTHLVHAGTSLSQQISADKNSMIPIEQLLPIEFNLPQMHHSPNLMKEIGPSRSKHVGQSKHSPSNKSGQSETSKSASGSASSSSSSQGRTRGAESPRPLFDLNLPLPPDDQK